MGTEKDHLNILLYGNSKEDKLITAHHLIDSVKGIYKRDIERIEKEAVEMPTSSSKYAWVSDKLKAERECGGITIDNVLGMFETTKYYFTVIDPDGFLDFGKKVLRGTSQVPCALLIIDPTVGGNEAGWFAFSAYALGVYEMICCCNKMDATTPKYSKDRYDQIVKEASCQLKKVMYSPYGISFVPISGSEGMIEKSTNLGWYEGPTLLEALDKLRIIKRPCDNRPARLTTEVKSVELHQKALTEALPGDKLLYVRRMVQDGDKVQVVSNETLKNITTDELLKTDVEPESKESVQCKSCDGYLSEIESLKTKNLELLRALSFYEKASITT